jgi:hypothetical protein
MTLLQASEESETRILTRVGVSVVSFMVMATAMYFAVNPFGRRSHDVISVAIEAPYVGQGVATGTPVIMHGVKIGRVVSVTSIAGGGVRLETDLQSGPTRGLTDAMGIDYRPSNYFGVTGVNVTPVQNGRPLQNGMQIKLVPKGNFSLQALIYRLGELSNGVFNQRLVDVIQRATQYVDAFNPLLETALIVGTSVATVQTVSTERLLRNTAGVSVAFPGTVDALISTGDNYLHTYFVDFDSEKFKQSWRYYPVLGERTQRYYENDVKLFQSTIKTDEFYERHLIPTFDTARSDLFGRIGTLLSSHMNDLTPAIESVRALTDTVPKILSPDSFAYTLTEIRKRFERMYAGSGDERALQVRIILDRLPGVAAPLGMVMGSA